MFRFRAMKRFFQEHPDADRLKGLYLRTAEVGLKKQSLTSTRSIIKKKE